MKLYHGTNSDFTGICLEKSKLGKDFGSGFYLTPEEAVAKRQAQRKFVQYGFDSPIVQTYEWDEEKSIDLKILRFDEYNIAWAEFILLNRRNMSRQQLHDYEQNFLYDRISHARHHSKADRGKRHDNASSHGCGL